MALTNGTLSLGTSLTISQGGGFDPISINNPRQISIENGTGPSQADRHYVLSSNVTSGAPTTLQLNGGTIVGRDGIVFSVVDLVSYEIVCHAASGGNLIVGGGSNPVANVADVLEPGAQMIYFTAGAGKPVVPTTGMNLKLDASAGTVYFDVYLTGHSV